MPSKTTRDFVLAAFLVATAAAPSWAEDEDPIITKLEKAKAAYSSTMEKVTSDVTAFFDKRENTARKEGNKKLVDEIKAERQAFDQDGEIPKSLPATMKTKIAIARAKIEAAYKSAISALTAIKKDSEATDIEKEFDSLNKISVRTVASADPFRRQTVWFSDAPKIKIIVTERNAEAFRARYFWGDRIERDVRGTVKDGKVSWFPKDVTPIRGGAGGTATGIISRDSEGNKIDFEWFEIDTGLAGKFTLRLGNPAK